MDVIDDDAKGGFRRIEVLTGPARRRRWSASEKGRIVAETLQADATVTEVARRWHVCPQQVWGWRRAARAGNLSLPPDIAVAAEPTFVPIVTEHAAVTPAPSTKAAPKPARAAVASSIEIALAGAVVRVAADTNSALLAEVLRAVRASAT